MHPRILFVVHEVERQFPYLMGAFNRQFEEFGTAWLDVFESELDTVFGTDEAALAAAVLGYAKFTLDSMKLQVRFQKTRAYDSKTYAEVADEAYQDRESMFGLYLPGTAIYHERLTKTTILVSTLIGVSQPQTPYRTKDSTRKDSNTTRNFGLENALPS